VLGELSLEFIFQFMLVFARLGTAFRRFPAVGSPYIHSRAKLFISLTITFVMIPVLAPYLPKYTDDFAKNIGYIAI
jgi:flagellar biosynthesis protein FliR